MLYYLIPKDEENDDSDYHNTIIAQRERPIHTADHRKYSPEEIRTAIEAINSKKVPRGDGITNEILQRAYGQLPNFFHTLYHQCLRQGGFPKIWKRVKVIPIMKPGKEDTKDPSKYRTISLINVGGTVFEKLLINRIMHYVYTNDLLNHNQF